jgi:hypothetical protein
MRNHDLARRNIRLLLCGSATHTVSGQHQASPSGEQARWAGAHVMPSRSDSAAQLAEFGLSPAVRQLTDEFWSWQLDRQWYLRLRAGLPVESLPDHGSTESAR